MSLSGRLLASCQSWPHKDATNCLHKTSKTLTLSSTLAPEDYIMWLYLLKSSLFCLGLRENNQCGAALGCLVTDGGMQMVNSNETRAREHRNNYNRRQRGGLTRGKVSVRGRHYKHQTALITFENVCGKNKQDAVFQAPSVLLSKVRALRKS